MITSSNPVSDATKMGEEWAKAHRFAGLLLLTYPLGNNPELYRSFKEQFGDGGDIVGFQSPKDADAFMKGVRTGLGRD